MASSSRPCDRQNTLHFLLIYNPSNLTHLTPTEMLQGLVGRNLASGSSGAMGCLEASGVSRNRKTLGLDRELATQKLIPKATNL